MSLVHFNWVRSLSYMYNHPDPYYYYYYAYLYIKFCKCLCYIQAVLHCLAGLVWVPHMIVIVLLNNANLYHFLSWTIFLVESKCTYDEPEGRHYSLWMSNIHIVLTQLCIKLKVFDEYWKQKSIRVYYMHIMISVNHWSKK